MHAHPLAIHTDREASAPQCPACPSPQRVTDTFSHSKAHTRITLSNGERMWWKDYPEYRNGLEDAKRVVIRRYHCFWGNCEGVELTR